VITFPRLGHCQRTTFEKELLVVTARFEDDFFSGRGDDAVDVDPAAVLWRETFTDERATEAEDVALRGGNFAFIVALGGALRFGAFFILLDSARLCPA
jgi:hypothetical protein